MAHTLLIVDDKKLLREALIDYLDTANYDFLQAESGEKALEIFRNRQVDLVILDHILPDLDGFAVLQLLKQAKPQVPVIGLTGDLTVDIREKYLQAGAYDIQTKSAIYEKLVPAINNAITGVKPERSDYTHLDSLAKARELEADNRVEESALYYREAGWERFNAGSKDEARELWQKSITLYQKAGRGSKADDVALLLNK